MLRPMGLVRLLLLAVMLLSPAAAWAQDAGASLKLHGIFSSNMVLQRDKPIKVWGWATPGEAVVVELGGHHLGRAIAAETDGAWSVTFEPREASAEPIALKVTSGGQAITCENIVVGDVWVMFGQSNMAFALKATHEADLGAAQGDLPLLRALRISTAEQDELQTDIPASVMPQDGWVVSTPETAMEFSAIGYAFASRVQRATGIPIGIIDNARGGASMESLVPEHMFDDDPVALRYYQSVLARQAEFSLEAEVARQVERWEQKVARDRANGVAEDRLDPRPTAEAVRSWNIPGKSPSDAASCYNGMFGAFIGYNIKGVLFHQGYNNAISNACRPVRYRVLMRLAIQGWRQDFNDPELAVGVIGLCAGGNAQHAENFETLGFSPGAYIREAQRLGVADVGDPERVVFLPAYDVRIPGLHPKLKEDHGERAARWALSRVYGMEVGWETASLVSAEQVGDELVLSFDRPVMPVDRSTIPEGFSIAGEDGRFYRAHARFRRTSDKPNWDVANKIYDKTVIHLWSPLVDKPVAARYAWSRAPMGNVYVDGMPWQPLPSFRTDNWDYPESEDPAITAMDGATNKAMQEQAQQQNADRLRREAELAVQVLERLRTLGYVAAGGE